MSAAIDDNLIELDGPRHTVPVDETDRPLIELDLEVCRFCAQRVPLNMDSECEACHAEANAALAARRLRNPGGMSPARASEVAAGGGTPAEQGFLSAIAEASVATNGKREQLEPTSRGAIDAPVHSEDSGAADAAVAAIKANRAAREEHERQAREAAAIAARAEAEQKRIEAEQVRADRAAQMRSKDLVGGAAAEGHGMAFGWRGKGDMTRGQIEGVLASAGLPVEWNIESVSPEAQASRALATLRADGFTIRPEKKSKRQVVEVKEYDSRWLVDSPNHGAAVGDSSGDVVLVATLIGDTLELDGDDALAERVQKEYKERLGAELCKSSDISGWLQSIMKDKLDAVRMGLGWYVTRSNAETGKKVCDAFEKVGWGDEEAWTALPIASGEQLQAGILKGLAFEVRAVLHQVAQERETAKTKENREDIGNKRAATFLGELKAVGRRVVAYGALLGADKVEELRTMIHDAIRVLESSLSEEDQAIVARFQNIWEEIEIDRKNNGGVL